MVKTIIDYILPEDQEEYKAIITRAAEAKANAPKAPRAPRAPMTPEQQIASTEKRLLKLQQKLAEARAKQAELALSPLPIGEE